MIYNPSPHFKARMTNHHQTSRFYEAETTYRPSVGDLKAAQEALGYPHTQYGWPYVVDVSHNTRHGRYYTKWVSQEGKGQTRG